MNTAQKLYFAIGGSAGVMALGWEADKKKRTNKQRFFNKARDLYQYERRYTHILSNIK